MVHGTEQRRPTAVSTQNPLLQSLLMLQVHPAPPGHASTSSGPPKSNMGVSETEWVSEPSATTAASVRASDSTSVGSTAVSAGVVTSGADDALSQPRANANSSPGSHARRRWARNMILSPQNLKAVWGLRADRSSARPRRATLRPVALAQASTLNAMMTTAISVSPAIRPDDATTV